MVRRFAKASVVLIFRSFVVRCRITYVLKKFMQRLSTLLSQGLVIWMNKFIIKDMFTVQIVLMFLCHTILANILNSLAK